MTSIDGALQMKKQELYAKYVDSRYQGIAKVINSEEYSEEDVKDFLRYIDAHPNGRGLADWEKFREIISKVKRVGVNGVLYRSDVHQCVRTASTDERGNTTLYLEVITDYGNFWVSKDRQVYVCGLP